ncbi:DNA-binding MarR family transcriptional regulator [Motilibacter peucedani]|uniref:DNA-binding MarR family transcriptional regulator n=1 Tax=Motilibacter peucedani TaxID=598650 RepID=A0A420XSW0_9ACTN|nr:MarR family winged helix-turn-helix transcriptional regulator [Motilibacter peucedani]RKS79906.1 DNA-binding MarR family transcriptional regulator [Motilibacter peucedani]
MPRRKPASGSEPQWLSAEQQRVWLAWMRVSLRLDYEINRELQEDSGLSRADYDVLVALSGSAEGRQRLSDLASTIGWERSRLSHHLQRMAARGLVGRTPSATDGRATDAVLTPAGRTAIEQAAPPHVASVRRLFFSALGADDLPVLAELLERVYDGVLDNGTLPPPPAVDI